MLFANLIRLLVLGIAAAKAMRLRPKRLQRDVDVSPCPRLRRVLTRVSLFGILAYGATTEACALVVSLRPGKLSLGRHVGRSKARWPSIVCGAVTEEGEYVFTDEEIVFDENDLELEDQAETEIVFDENDLKPEDQAETVIEESSPELIESARERRLAAFRQNLWDLTATSSGDEPRTFGKILLSYDAKQALIDNNATYLFKHVDAGVSLFQFTSSALALRMIEDLRSSGGRVSADMLIEGEVDDPMDPWTYKRDGLRAIQDYAKAGADIVYFDARMIVVDPEFYAESARALGCGFGIIVSPTCSLHDVAIRRALLQLLEAEAVDVIEVRPHRSHRSLWGCNYNRGGRGRNASGIRHPFSVAENFALSQCRELMKILKQYSLPEPYVKVSGVQHVKVAKRLLEAGTTILGFDDEPTGSFFEDPSVIERKGTIIRESFH